MKIFIDTSAFIALFLKTDKNHLRVKEKFDEYKQHRAQFITTNLIISELYTRLIYSTNQKVTKDLVSIIDKLESADELVVLYVDENWFSESKKVFKKFLEHKLSIVDADACFLCKELGITEIFTLDSDFKKVGLKTSF
jgi:predicted nucleic acid-binding protein